MNLQQNRENTFWIDFSNLPKKPSIKDVHQFIARDLGLPREKTKRVQINHVQICVFVKTADLETAEQIVEEHEHVREINKKKYTIRIRMEDGCTNVKLHDLTEDVSDEQIRRYMTQYGKVISVTELLWNEDFDYHGIPSGIRSVKMLLKCPIKSYVTIQGQCAYVKYAGQQATCRHCGEYVHIGIPCVQNKKLLVQKVSVNECLRSSDKESFASVLKNSGQAQAKPSGKQAVSNEADSPMSEDENDGMEDDYTVVRGGKRSKHGDLKNPQATSNAVSGNPAGSGAEQHTLIVGANGEQVVFKTPIHLPGKHKRNDGNETDSSTASTSSKGKRGPGRPRKSPPTDPEALPLVTPNITDDIDLL